MKKNKIVIIGILVSIIFVIIGNLWLSQSIETLDKVAEDFNVSESLLWSPPIPDYELVGLEGNLFVNSIIGIAFTLLTLTFTFVVGKALKLKNHQSRV